MLIASTVHAPYITAWPDQPRLDHRQAADAGFALLSDAFNAPEIRTVIVVSTEHIVNLQPRLAPAFIVGTGSDHEVLPEPQFNLSDQRWLGTPDLAGHLVQELYREGFDVAHSSALKLDHGCNLPLLKIGLKRTTRVIPIIINSIFPPLPSLQRCAAMGKAIGQIIRHAGLDGEVALLATGGISHAVGTPGMEVNDPAFDQRFIQQLVDGDLEAACAYTDEALDARGNGTHEIRTWLVAAGAAMPARARAICNLPYVDGWYTGIHQLMWDRA